MSFFTTIPDGGGPPNVFTAHPQIYRLWSEMSQALMRGPSRLSPGERELILAYAVMAVLTREFLSAFRRVRDTRLIDVAVPTRAAGNFFISGEGYGTWHPEETSAPRRRGDAVPQQVRSGPGSRHGPVNEVVTEGTVLARAPEGPGVEEDSLWSEERRTPIARDSTYERAGGAPQGAPGSEREDTA
jgi:hypothetical protein